MTIINILKNDIKNALLKGVFHLFTASLFSQIILFILGVFLARFLGPEDLGHIRVMLVVIQFADVAANFGMTSAIVKYVSEYQSEEAKRKVLSQGLFINFLSASLVSIILFLLSRNTNIIKDDIAKYYIQFLCWMLPFVVINSSIIGSFQGRKQIKKMSFVNISQQSFSFLATFALTYFLKLNGYVIARIGYVVIISLVLLALTIKDIVLKWDKAIFKKMFRYSSFALLATIFSTLISSADTLCISSILKDATLVGYYGVAMMIARGLMIIPSVISQTAFPYMSEKTDDFLATWNLLWRLIKRFSLIMGFVCVTVFILSHWIIILSFGQEYMLSIQVLRVLMLGTFVYSLMNASGNIIAAIGRTDISFYITVITGAFNIAMNIVLIRYAGIIGAAWATVLTYMLNLIIGGFWWWNFYNKKIKA